MSFKLSCPLPAARWGQRNAVALAAGLCALTWGASAQAQTQAQTTPTDYVVTAARSPEATGQSVRPVQVITAEDIRQSGASSLPELLGSLGGVEMASNGGMGQIASLFIRGAGRAHTVVLLDGVRLNSPADGGAALDAIPLALIERVEVLAGPSSSLYGADAIGGVVQIFTKGGRTAPGASLALTAGNQGLRQLSGSYVGVVGATDLSLGVNALNTDGYNVTTPSSFSYSPDRDGYRSRSVSARASHDLGSGHRLGAQWLRSDSQIQFDDGGAGDARSDNLTQTLAANWSGPLASGVQSELRVSRAWGEAHSGGLYPGVLDTRQDQLSWLNRIALGAGTLTAGVEVLRQEVSSDTPYELSSRSIRAGLLGWKARYGALDVQADLRQDNNSQFGNHSTGQLSAAWQASPALRLRGSAGSGFHAPSFDLMYYPGFGNPNLKPETSHSLELGADAQWAGLKWGATWFDNRLSNLIESPPPTYLPFNVAKAHIQGLALSLAGALGEQTRIKLNLTLQNPENADTGAQLQRRAKQFGAIRLTRQMGELSLGTDLTGVGTRYDSATEAAGTRMGGYGLVAVFGTWRLNADWALEARVNNAADRHYETAQGYVPPGRQAQLTLRWTPAI